MIWLKNSEAAVGESDRSRETKEWAFAIIQVRNYGVGPGWYSGGGRK